jgi:hypothetical protein
MREIVRDDSSGSLIIRKSQSGSCRASEYSGYSAVQSNEYSRARFR